MLTRLTLFSWLVSLEALDTAPERQAALRAGYDLAVLAIAEDVVAGDAQAHGRVARLLAELESDGWIAWDWIRYATDARPEPPPATRFDDQALQRVQNIRITPEGYTAFAARQRLGAQREGPSQHPDRTAMGTGTSLYDLFISHASEDKDAVARPLARALTALGFAVWFDEERLEVGSSLRASIDAGLAESRFGVVVLSESFFAKPWPPRELDGLFAREVAEGAEIILPLWHDIDDAFMASKAPTLADRLALRSDIGIPQIAERLARRLRREQGEDELRARIGGGPPPAPAGAGPDGRGVFADAVGASDEASPLEKRAETIAMLRQADDIGLRELQRYERRMFEDGVLATLQQAGDDLGASADPERLRPVNDELWRLVDRRLASLLPVVEYRPRELGEEFAALAAFAGRSTPTRSPYSAWIDGPRWPVWLVTLIIGTASIALDRPEVALALWRQPAAHDGGRPLPAARLGGGAELGQALLRARPGKASSGVELWHPAFSVYDSDLLRTHYEEIMRGGDTPDAVLGFLSRAGDFLWLCGALAGRDGVKMIRFWSASQVHPTLRERLNGGDGRAARLAQVLGVEQEKLVAQLDTWIDEVEGPSI